HEVVAARFECRDRGTGADLDCSPRPLALLPDPSCKKARSPHAFAADHATGSGLSSLPDSRCMGPRCRAAGMADGGLDRSSCRHRRSAIGDNCDSSYPGLEARAGLLRRTRAQYCKKTVNRMRSHLPNRKAWLL